MLWHSLTHSLTHLLTFSVRLTSFAYVCTSAAASLASSLPLFSLYTVLFLCLCRSLLSSLLVNAVYTRFYSFATLLFAFFFRLPVLYVSLIKQVCTAFALSAASAVVCTNPRYGMNSTTKYVHHFCFCAFGQKCASVFALCVFATCSWNYCGDSE